MLRVGPVDGDVALLVLDLAQRVEAVHRAVVHRKPGPRPAVVDVMRGGVAGRRQGNAIDTRELAEVIIEGMVFLHNNNDMLNGVRRLVNFRAGCARGHPGTRRPGYCYDCYRRINPPQFGLPSDLFGVH
jgi:hypothetical protein